MDDKVYAYKKNHSAVETMSKVQIEAYVSAGKVEKVTIPVSAWEGVASPYVADIKGDFKESDAVNVYPIFDDEQFIFQQLSYDKVSYSKSYDGGVKIYCDLDKPSVDLVIGMEVKLWQ